MKRTHQKNQKGFTLLETFVAVFIFSLTLAGFLLITTRGVFSTRNAIHETIASSLAQEGLELVERKRDYNFLNNVDPWTGYLVQICENDCTISVDASIYLTDDYATPCPTSGCPKLRKVDRKYVNGSSGELTPYTRTITVKKFGGNFAHDDDSVLVKSVVVWESGGTERSVLYEKTLTNWYESL